MLQNRLELEKVQNVKKRLYCSSQISGIDLAESIEEISMEN
jgi:hypothetical protein